MLGKYLEIQLLSLNLGDVTLAQVGHCTIGHDDVCAIEPFVVSGQVRTLTIL